MKLSIITITYNCEDFIEDYLKSLILYKPQDSEVILVDNNSGDATREKIKKFKGIKLITSEKNLGFGRGCNLGAKNSRGDFLFFINPDSKISENIFDKLVNFYEENEGIGLISPKLVYQNGEIQESVKRLPSLWGAIKEYIFGINHAYSQYAPETDRPVEVDVVYGAAILIKSDLFEKLKGFDERFFMYYEDIDLCRRIKKLGKKIIYYPGVKVRHLLGASKTTNNRDDLNLQSSRIYHGYFEYLLLNFVFLIPRIKRKLRLIY